MHATYTHAQHENIMDIIIVNYSTLLNICMQEPSKIECVPSYGVLITQRQLEAENKSNGSTRLIRNLMSAYFSLEEVANWYFMCMWHLLPSVHHLFAMLYMNVRRPYCV